MEDPVIYIKHTTERFRREIEHSIQNYPLIPKKTLEPLKQFFSQKSVAGIVLEIYGNLKETQTFLAENRYLAKLPIIAVMNENNWEAIRKLGEIGIDRIISIEALHNIEQIIPELLNQKETGVKLEDMYIDKQHDRSDTLQEILELIENNYLNISTVEELAEILNMNSCYLTQMFKDQKLYKPKELLTYMKIRHALNLMEQSHLSLQEISDLSGFDNYQQFRRCVIGIFDKSPRDVQHKVKETGAELFWKEHGPYPPFAITIISS